MTILTTYFVFSTTPTGMCLDDLFLLHPKYPVFLNHHANPHYLYYYTTSEADTSIWIKCNQKRHWMSARTQWLLRECTLCEWVGRVLRGISTVRQESPVNSCAERSLAENSANPRHSQIPLCRVVARPTGSTRFHFCWKLSNEISIRTDNVILFFLASTFFFWKSVLSSRYSWQCRTSQGICRKIAIHVWKTDAPSGVNFKILQYFSPKSSMNICLFVCLLILYRIMETIGSLIWNSHIKLLVWKYVNNQRHVGWDWG